MDDEPSNAASVAGEATAGPVSSWSAATGEALLADDFVLRDHRSLIGLPEMDKTQFLSSFDIELELGRRESTRVPLAVRGDRLVLVRYTISYEDGSETAHLSLTQWDPAVAQIQRMEFFDLDDLDAAVTRLDQFQAAIESNEHESDTR